MIYINSTIPARQSFSQDGSFSPIHYWGYKPHASDIVLSNRSTRFQIVFRAKLGGLDLPVLARTLFHILRGERQIYLVTQPDLIYAIPFLKWIFPSLLITTWVWTADEVSRWRRSLRSCSAVFALTAGALEALRIELAQQSSSLQLWGADPNHYKLVSEPVVDSDLGLFGLTTRDVATVKSLMSKTNWTLLVTQRASLELLGDCPVQIKTRVRAINPRTESEMVGAMHRVRAVLIPLYRAERQPAGYTNLIEALLCGRAVVIPKNSTIPQTVLGLEGVFMYEAENVNSMSLAVDAALHLFSQPGASKRIASQATKILNGNELSSAIHSVFSQA